MTNEPKTEPNEVGAEWLRAWRKRYGYTREELAEETRVSLKTIQNYEQGIRMIPEIFKRTLALILKVRRLQE